MQHTVCSTCIAFPRSPKNKINRASNFILLSYGFQNCTETAVKTAEWSAEPTKRAEEFKCFFFKPKHHEMVASSSGSNLELKNIEFGYDLCDMLF